MVAKNNKRNAHGVGLRIIPPPIIAPNNGFSSSIFIRVFKKREIFGIQFWFFSLERERQREREKGEEEILAVMEAHGIEKAGRWKIEAWVAFGSTLEALWRWQ